jgi:hypothetical protein
MRYSCGKRRRKTFGYGFSVTINNSKNRQTKQILLKI